MDDKERAEICYECTGYGDDYYYDVEKDEYVCACDNCWVNQTEDEDDQNKD